MEPLTFWDLVLRMALAFAAGGLIGWEREGHGRPAGLRTTILACVASAAAMVISELLLQRDLTWNRTEVVRADPARMAQGILTGIGFLGAGTIIRHENLIRGVTTAASLWFATVLGLAFGVGQFAIGFVGVGIAMFTLLALPSMEKRMRRDFYATLKVTATLDGISESDLRNRVESQGPAVVAQKLEYDLRNKERTIQFELRLNRQRAMELSGALVAGIARYPGVLRVDWL